MKTLYIYLILLLILTSCASILNNATIKLKIKANKPTKLSVDNREYQFEKEIEIYVPRKKENLILKAETDSVKKEIEIQSKNSGTYYLNIYTYFVGFFIDAKNPKRYTYNRNIYIDYNSPKLVPSRFFPPEKGQVNIYFSVPWANNLLLQPQGEPIKNNIGFWGTTLGMNYYYRKNKFIDLKGGVATDFIIPVPGLVFLGFLYDGERESMSSFYISLTDNYQVKRFSFGYGINFSKNIWDVTYKAMSHSNSSRTREDTTKSSNSFGLTFNTYYQFGRYFCLGLNYRPTFLNVSPNTRFQYQHLVSLDFLWKFRLRK